PPQMPGFRANYVVNNVSCTSWAVVNIPITPYLDDVTINLSPGEYWHGEPDWYNDGTYLHFYGTACKAETWNQAGIDYCRENPFDSACQPVMPTTDAGQFDYSS